jgi:hypothetical protein
MPKPAHATKAANATKFEAPPAAIPNTPAKNSVIWGDQKRTKISMTIGDKEPSCNSR